MLDESELEGSTVYPVDRATRPITPQELKDRYPEIREARVKELKSWIDNHTGHAEKLDSHHNPKVKLTSEAGMLVGQD